MLSIVRGAKVASSHMASKAVAARLLSSAAATPGAAAAPKPAAPAAAPTNAAAASPARVRIVLGMHVMALILVQYAYRSMAG